MGLYEGGRGTREQLSALAECTHGEGYEDERSDCHVLKVRVHLEHVQRVGDDSREEHAKKRADYLAFAACHRCSSDDHGPDGLKLDPVPGGGLRCPYPGKKKGCRGADENAVDDEEDELVEVDGNPRKVAGLGVASNGECPASQLHVFQDEVNDEISRDADDEKQRDDIEKSLCSEELELAVDELQDTLCERQ